MDTDEKWLLVENGCKFVTNGEEIGYKSYPNGSELMALYGINGILLNTIKMHHSRTNYYRGDGYLKKKPEKPILNRTLNYQNTTVDMEDLEILYCAAAFCKCKVKICRGRYSVGREGASTF